MDEFHRNKKCVYRGCWGILGLLAKTYHRIVEIMGLSIIQNIHVEILNCFVQNVVWLVTFLFCSKCGMVDHFFYSCQNPALICHKYGVTEHSACVKFRRDHLPWITHECSTRWICSITIKCRVMYCRHCSEVRHTIKTCPYLRIVRNESQVIPESDEHTNIEVDEFGGVWTFIILI